jgi:hypothetical protein
MGTSTGYTAPTSPQWRALKGRVSRAAPKGPLSRDSAADLVRDFVRVGGGRSGFGGGGGARGGGSAAQVAANVGGFVSTVASRGLAAALDEIGLSGLIGRPVSELLDALLDVLGGPGSTIDDVDARTALSRLRDELFGQAQTFEELEALLAAQGSGSTFTGLLTRFFAFYLHEQFCRVFYERLVAKIGNTKADGFLDGILDFLQSKLEEVHLERDVRTINWTSEDGRAFAQDVLELTLDVFGG